jgi:hypothetical protein
MKTSNAVCLVIAVVIIVITMAQCEEKGFEHGWDAAAGKVMSR